MDLEIPKDWLPVLTWPKFMYKQQRQFVESGAWQTWFIAGNGTGKTLTVYWSAVAQMLGLHPLQLGEPPIKVKALVPSFDNVTDVALEKLLSNQRILFSKDKRGKPILTDKQRFWIDFLEQQKALVASNLTEGWIEVGPMLPKSAITSKKTYSKDHRGIELKNGSSIWWATSEQGWQYQRGGEQDILLIDEEGDERVTDECVRGLRNAKGGGKIVAALTPPYQPGAGPTWTKEKVLEASFYDKDIKCIRACMVDNPAIDDSFIKRFSKGKTQKQIDVQVYGKYPTWGDLVHPDFQDRPWNPRKIDGHLLPNDIPLPDSWDVQWVMAFDWHASKPCAAIWGYVDSDGNLTIFDELDRDLAEGKEITELVDIFKSIEGHPFTRRNFRRWQDPASQHKYNAVQRGFNAWDAFRIHGIVTAVAKNRDGDLGVTLTNEYFRGNGKDAPRVFIYEKCKWLRRYLGNHYWQRTESGKARPDVKWSDYPVCLKYICQEISWSKTNKRFDFSKLPYLSYQASKERKSNVIDVAR